MSVQLVIDMNLSVEWVDELASHGWSAVHWSNMTTAVLLDRILGKLEHVRVRCPELRFGQLIATIGMLAEDETGHSLWDVDDADFAFALERFAGDMARRDSPLAEPIVALESQEGSRRTPIE